MQPLTPNSNPLGPLRQLNDAQAGRQQALERLSTGLKINRAADDPAGLISSDQLRAVLEALEAETRAVQRTDAVANTADAALAQASEQLIDARGLAVAAANTGGLSDAERDAMQLEADSIAQSVKRTLTNADFAGERLFDGETVLRAGDDELTLGQLPPTEIDDIDVAADPSGAAAVLVSTVSNLQSMRQRLGAFQSNSLSSRAASVQEEAINTASALSDIRDTDYAKEAAEEARFAILEQTARTAIMLTVTSSSRAISLLRG